MKKLEVEEKLKAARLEQVTHKEHLLSIEAGRERAEFERALRYKHHHTISMALHRVLETLRSKNSAC